MTDQLPAALAALRNAYPRQDFPDDSVALYSRMLADLNPQAVSRAIKRIICKSTWLPSISEIRVEVAEEQLQLPSPEEAWQIAMYGDLREAPPEVRASVDAVGGRWAILHGDRPDFIAKRFRDDYTSRRARSVLVTAGGVIAAPALPQQKTLAALPVTEKMKPRPMVLRWLRRNAGLELEPPTEAEKRDAMLFLRDGPLDPENPADDPLYALSELLMAEACDETLA